ncbi:hypothetical protein TMM008_57740 [Pseudomonas sp. 008]|jgi:hypothetical protein|nr:hypothetical protein TMM008_57740 [Pseudomonas sp. 008]
MPQDESVARLERAGKGAGFVMVGAETSDTSCGYFPDVKKGVAGQYHLKTREQMRLREEILLAEYYRLQK